MSTRTPQERIRASIALTHAWTLAERLLQHDKANPSFKLEDLKSDEERQVYTDAVLAWLADADGRTERANQINALRGHGFAVSADEAERVAAMARADIDRFIERQRSGESEQPRHSGSVKPGYCWVCRLLVGSSSGATLHLSDNLITDVHNTCAMKDDRCVPVSKVSFILKESR